MPVKFEEDFDFSSRMNLLEYLTDETSNPVTDILLPDDIWKKFEIDYTEFSALDTLLEEVKFSEELCPKNHSEIRNHDCMWAGHCASKEHPADEPRLPLHCFIPMPPEPIMKPPAPINIKEENVIKPANGQQSLLKTHVRAAAVLQTPPMSDDEEAKSKPTNVLRLLNEAIEECDLEEDSDLCDYFEDKDIKEEVEEIEVSEPEVVDVEATRSFHPAESDHSYHKGKHSAMQTANFGLDTPSDSEEEIDVVNVNDKFPFVNKTAVFSFPTNPSTRDRQQIQRRMATAISKKRIPPPQGIKTIMPVRKMAAPETTPLKKKSTETTRGVKRTRQYRTPVTTPYKRKIYGHSSDSEPEPSEKRSLHNNMERQRRIDLRNAFEDLRVLVPEVSKKERAAKVVILREAAQYCDFLTTTSKGYSKQFDELKKKQEFLRRRVSQLRRNLAAKR